MRVMRVVAFLVFLVVLGLGYLYSASTFTPTSFPGASNSEPTREIAGVDCMSSCQDFQPFVDSAAVFSTINVPGAVDARLWGINDSGAIVHTFFDGTTSSSGGGTFTTINIPGVDDGSVSGIDDSGEIVGAIGSSTSVGGFLYSGSFLTPTNVPGKKFTKTKDVNNNGQMVGTFENPPPTPEPATMTLLGSGMMGLIGMLRRRNHRT